MTAHACTHLQLPCAASDADETEVLHPTNPALLHGASMVEVQKAGLDGLLDMERELTCSVSVHEDEKLEYAS